MSAINVVRKFFPKVNIVVDSSRNAMIEVTKADAGSRAVKDHSACAMAVACKRKFHLDGVIISRTIAYLIKGKQARRFHLPESVSREVVSFDRGSGFSPGKYELSRIPPMSRLGVHAAGVVSGNKSSAPRAKAHFTTNVRSVLGGKRPDDE